MPPVCISLATGFLKSAGKVRKKKMLLKRTNSWRSYYFLAEKNMNMLLENPDWDDQVTIVNN